MAGSEWYRWELHIHTPQTKKNSQFEGKNCDEQWNKYYKRINEYIDTNIPEKNIKAIGVTDYLSIDNYIKVREDKQLPESIELILPNVEMRLNLKGGKTPINIHCIFNPDIVDELEDRFFSRLKFNDGRRDYSATRKELIALGKSIDSKIKDDNKALEKGVENFVIELSCLQDMLKDDDLRQNTIWVVANNETDGVSGLKNSQFEGTRKAIYTIADAIFSGNPNDVDYFLGKKADTTEEMRSKYGGVMPCFHGSDAHCLEKVFEPDLKRYCYIKSEITFDGLKQTLTDPEDRVFIGERPSVLNRIIENPEKL
ncbi:hypothetical protein [Pseudolactococcus reticulitermitis]|uniref:Uncharacterized protein n=1 Tax=Pseudolactococcus reticulitermitis TaxID=2025039 RepID=A0A224XAF1_9LACT|nr:hypothetical protein [Lactococcus reticulitermitis]GAX46922.1 hypothetical protein RsY01_502 [Lactococcus reticulitermitis]